MNQNNNHHSDDRRIYTMTEEKPTKAVLQMGLPVTMGMLFMVAYNLVDTYFIGLLNDDYQLAATNLAYPVMMAMIAIAGIVGNGGASYIARCLGADRKEEADHTLTIGFELLLLCSILLSLIGFLFLNPMTALLGAQEHTFQYTKEYIGILFAGSFFIMGNYAIGQLLRSEGSALYSMIGMMTGTAMNIALDPLFIFAFHLGIRGAAIATVLGNAAGVLIYLYYYGRKKTLLHPSVRLLKFKASILREIMIVGIPHTLEQFFTTAAMIVNNNLAAGYGELSVAAMGIANKIMSFGSYVYQGMAAGCQPLMGYNYGAKNFPRMKQLIKSGIVVTTAIELAIMLLFGVLASHLIGLFSESETVIAVGARTLRAFILMLPFVGSVSIVRNAFNAMGKAQYAFGITLVRQLLLYIPFLLLFNRLWGYQGLIHAQPVEEAICMVLALLVLFRFLRKAEQTH